MSVLRQSLPDEVKVNRVISRNNQRCNGGSIKNEVKYLKLRKCKFIMQEMEFLGHTLSDKGLRPSDEKIKAISQISAPTTKKGVQSFLGLAGFYRRYIKDFSKKSHELRQLTKKDSDFMWTDRHCSEFGT